MTWLRLPSAGWELPVLLALCTSGCSMEWSPRASNEDAGLHDGGPLVDTGVVPGMTGDGSPGATDDDASILAPTCTTDLDCAIDQVCRDGSCQAGPLCSERNPCPGGLSCVAERCVFVPPERLPSRVAPTGGGGQVGSDRYRLRFNVGSPQPVGVSAGDAHTLELGPGAGAR